MNFKQLRDLRSQSDSFRAQCDGWSAANEITDKELAALVRKWNLASPEKELDAIGRLQIRSALLPAKIADMEVLRAEREQQLRDGVNEFVRTALSPLIQDKLRDTRAKLAVRMRDLVQNPEVYLEREVENSAPIQTLNGFYLAASVDNGFRYPEAAKHAEAMLKLHTDVEQFRLSSSL